MVIRNDEKKADKAPVVEEEVEEETQEQVSGDNIPMIPNYLDLILGEVHAIRLALEKS